MTGPEEKNRIGGGRPVGGRSFNRGRKGRYFLAGQGGGGGGGGGGPMRKLNRV